MNSMITKLAADRLRIYRKKTRTEILELKDKRFSYIHELSGGLQQRTAIARALASKPDIIFADEPTGNLDEHNSAEVMRLLRLTQKKYHQTVLMVTHNLRIVRQTDRPHPPAGKRKDHKRCAA